LGFSAEPMTPGNHAALPPGIRPVQNPPNPFSRQEIEFLDGLLDEDGRETLAKVSRLEVFADATRSIIAHNDSPDVGFDWSVNPYRGCYHACAYCSARHWHEKIGFGAGTDFDRKIVLKPDAPALLRDAFEAPSWRGETLFFSGATDCYQPLEAQWRLTRGCLEVCAAYRNPVGVMTKAPLVERDIDVLVELSRVTHLTVSISIPFWDAEKARAIEPSVATPQRRMRTIAALARAGIDVGVNVAPLIPGLSDEDVPSILRAASDAGARHAETSYLMLPGSVAPVFVERLSRALPLRVEKVLRRVREARGGQLNDARFHKRDEAEGNYAAATRALFDSMVKKLGLERRNAARVSSAATTFSRLGKRGDQLALF
jgi:DNA repair photolyase